MGQPGLVQAGQGRADVVEQPGRLAAGQAPARAEHDGQVRAGHEVDGDHGPIARQGDDLPDAGQRGVAQGPQLGQAPERARPAAVLGDVEQVDDDVAPVPVQAAQHPRPVRADAPHGRPDGQARVGQDLAVRGRQSRVLQAVDGLVPAARPTAEEAGRARGGGRGRRRDRGRGGGRVRE